MALALGGALWASVGATGLSWQHFFDSQSWLRDIGLGLAAGAGLAGAWFLLRLIPPLKALEKHIAEIVGQFHRSELWALCLLSGFAEELFFRGAMLPAWGIWVSAAAFGVAHLGPGRAGVLWAAVAALAGLGLGSLYLWTGTLVAPMIAHATVNGINLIRVTRRSSANHPEVE